MRIKKEKGRKKREGLIEKWSRKKKRFEFAEDIS